MGKWKNLHKQEQKDSKYNAKRRGHNAAMIKKIATAAAAFMAAHKSQWSKNEQLATEYDAVQQAIVENLKKLVDLEKELEAAKKTKDKTKVREIEGKIKPLEKAHAQHASKHDSMAKTGGKYIAALSKAIEDLRKALKGE